MTPCPSCSVVTRCYSEEDHIGRLLSGIVRQTVSNAEIIVVASGSSDATLSIASRYSVEILTIRPQEFSFGQSLNIAREAASAHVYPVYKDWLERLLAPFSDPQTALVYGKQRGVEICQYAEQRVFAQWYPGESHRRQGYPCSDNADAAMRRALWTELPYDEDLTGLEDLDRAKRAMALGYHLACSAEAEVVHVHNETPQQTYNRYRLPAIAVKRIFPQERFGIWDLVRLWTTNAFSDNRHALRDGVLRREWRAIPRFRLMQFWGTYRGYLQHRPVKQRLRRACYYLNHQRPVPEKSGSERIEARAHYETHGSGK